ncbi:MAG: tetratricopeptide repeat protein, partial [Ardenticatenaceae bacterium]
LKQVYLPPEQLDFMSRSASMTMTTQNLRLALAQEFQTLATLRHPHIISVLDYGFGQDGQPYFTMTLLEAPQTIVEAAQNLDLTSKIGLIQQMLQALAYLHRRGILHRDVKPSNVFVSEDGRVRVLDFGLSVAKEEAQSSSGGTFAYMAPELLLGQSASSEASDLYAVGVIAYQLLLHRHPFDQNSPHFLDQVLKQVPDLSALNPSLAEVISTLLKKQPQERYESAEACLAALSEALGQPAPAESVAIRESYLQAATFVGREDEMATLTKALQEAQAGHGSAWLIGGESGVGKSRLIDELRIQALVKGCLLLHGQAERDGGGLPYELWREPLRHLVVATAELDDLSAAVLMPLLPDIEQLLARRIAPAPILEAEATQQRLFTTIASLFRQASQPIVLILEDLQWSQEGLRPLPYLTRQMSDSSLLILGTYRDDERPELPSLLKGWQVMALARLSEASIAELSRAILGEVGQQAELLALLQRETEGNAFFLVEVVRALAEEAGRLGGIGNMSLPEKVMPQGIATIVQRRLARVPEAAHQLLNLAAVAGRALDLAVIEAFATETCPEERGINMHNWWLPACANAAVLELQHNRWQFAHDKIREGLLASLSAETLMAHHRQIAQTIEQIYPDDPNQAAQLMYHWGQVGDSVKERDYAYLAGTHAASRYANTEAITLLNRAIQLTKISDWQKRYAIHLAREKVHGLIGHQEGQQEDLAQLDDLVTKLDQSEKAAVVALRQAIYAQRGGNYPATIAKAQEVITLAQHISDKALIASGYLEWGSSLMSQGDYQAAQDFHALSLSLYREIGAKAGEANALYYLAVGACEQGRYQQGAIYLEQTLALSREIGDRKKEARILNSQGIVASTQGNDEQALLCYKQSLAISREIGDRTREGTVLNNLGVLARNLGAYQQSKAYFEESLAINRATGDRTGEANRLNNLGLLAQNQGLYDQAQTYYEESLALNNEMRTLKEEANTLNNLGVVAENQGAYDRAQVYFEQSLAIARQIGHREGEGNTLNDLAVVANKQGLYEQAQRYLQQSLSIRHEVGDRAGEARSLHNLGWASYGLGAYQQAEAYYQKALTIRRDLKHLHHAVEDLAGLARVALAQQADLTPYLEQLLAYFAHTQTLEGTCNPFSVYLSCYRCLQASNDGQADAILAQAYHLLQERASKIGDVNMRRSFLQNVPEHREIVRLFENTSPDSEAVSAEHQRPEPPAKRPLSELLAKIISQVGAERGYILLRQADGSLESASGTPPLSANDLISRTIINQVIQRNTGLVIRNAMTDRHFARARSIMKGRIRSVLCVPLREKEHAIGAIYLEHRSKRGKFGQQDLAAVEGLAEQMAEAMSKRR